MVGYYQAYKGSTQTPLIYKGSTLIKKVYKGSTLVYQIGFDPVTYNAGSSLTQFTVPDGVSKIHVDCVASRGYGSSGYGKGGRVQCDISVNGGDVLYITVGNIPSGSSSASYNASDIRIGGTEYANRVIVAGGGGSKAPNGTNGGDGGGLTGGNSGQAGYQTPAYGGTQSAGGSRSNNTGGDVYVANYGYNGTLGMGGSCTDGGAGAGGAGYYGGGGGSAFAITSVGATYSGGGGGSSYTNSDCSNVTHTQGHQDGAGYITISFVE